MKKTNKVKILSLFLSIILVIGVISSFIVFSENDSDTSKKPLVEITNCSHPIWEDWEAYGNYHGRKCRNCSEIEYLSHDYNENGICKLCGAEENGEVETHECKFNTTIQLNRVNPTCTKEGVCYFPCEFSGCDKTKESVLDLIPHQYSGDWQELDDDYHKQICEMCNSAYRTEEHRFNSYVSKPATSTTEGEKTKTCGVCQKTIIEVIPAFGDTSDTTGDISTDSPEIEKCTHSRTTYEYINLLYHYVTCPDCEAATKAMHLCFERNSPKYNVFISGDANKHRQTCPCGYSIDADHTFTDNSDFCVYCGACNWHIYSSITSSYDSVSGEYVNQYVCEVCGYAKTYTCDPVFVDRVKSTCTTQGYAEAECSDCRGTIVIYKPLAPHSYSGGYCSTCGVADPNYTPSFPDDSCSHDWENGVCSMCSLVCQHAYGSDGICHTCGLYDAQQDPEMRCQHLNAYYDWSAQIDCTLLHYDMYCPDCNYYENLTRDESHAWLDTLIDCESISSTQHMETWVLVCTRCSVEQGGAGTNEWKSHGFVDGYCSDCGYTCLHDDTSGTCSICGTYLGSSSGDSIGDDNCVNASQHGIEYVYIGCSPYGDEGFEYTLYYSCEFCSYSMTTKEYGSSCLGLDSCAHSSVDGEGSTSDDGSSSVECDHDYSWTSEIDGCYTYGVCSNCGERLTSKLRHNDSDGDGFCDICGSGV